MPLEADELNLFQKLYASLLWFVNQCEEVTDEPFKNPSNYQKLPPLERIKIRDCLATSSHLIDMFVEENPCDLDEDELEIVRGWNGMVSAEFYVERCLAKQTIFITVEAPVVVYGVQALWVPFKDFIGDRLPYRCWGVLLPFRGQIVYDGMLEGEDTKFGANIRAELKADYEAARDEGRIVTSLPTHKPSRSSRSTVKKKTRRKTRPEKPTIARLRKAKLPIPDESREAFDAVVEIIEEFCQKHLDDGYATVCRKAADVLARLEPSPLNRGKPASWASGILRAIGWVNFLGDPSMPHHIKMADIDKGVGVSEATGSARATDVRKLLDLVQFDPDWTVPSMVDQNPLIWTLKVNGFMIDIRELPRDAQEVAFRQGLIPYIPADREGD